MENGEQKRGPYIERIITTLKFIKENPRSSVADIQKKIGVARDNAYRHLAILRKNGFIWVSAVDMRTGSYRYSFKYNDEVDVIQGIDHRNLIPKRYVPNTAPIPMIPPLEEETVENKIIKTKTGGAIEQTSNGLVHKLVR